MLFDKFTGTTTLVESDGISDSSATWRNDQFKNWYVSLGGLEFRIISNTQNKLFFSNSLAVNFVYEISFITRNSLAEIESDSSNTVKIPTSLINNKYNIANTDINNKVYSYLRGLYRDSFDPMNSIFNLFVLQQSYSYYVLSKIYQDLSIDQDSFESFKGYNMYEKSYNDSIKDSLSLLQVDLNSNGVVDLNEQINPVSTFSFYSR